MRWNSPWLHSKSAVFIKSADNMRSGFIKFIKSYAEEHDELAYYIDNGIWRDKSRSPNGNENHLREADNECYYNTQTCLLPSYSYAEGFAVNNNGAIAHAWLENENDVVIELSPALQDMNIDYWGATFENDLVRDVMVRRGHASPIVEAVV